MLYGQKSGVFIPIQKQEDRFKGKRRKCGSVSRGDANTGGREQTDPLPSAINGLKLTH